MSLEYKILGQELVSYTDVEGTDDTTSYYVSYEETGGPLFVALSSDPYNSLNLARSTDGVVWNSSSINVPGSGLIGWSQVAYGDGKFVAFGQGLSNYTGYSTDGISWTTAQAPFNMESRKIIYGNDKFVSVSSGENSFYSTDGITWTQTSMPGGSINWESVTYGDGKFIAVGLSSTAAVSADGISWMGLTMPANNSENRWSAVAYGGGKFVALLSLYGEAAYSTSGTSWTMTSIPAAQWSSIVYADNKFVALAYSSSIGAYSTDGITWTQTSMPVNGSWTSIAYGAGKFVAINYPGSASSTTSAAYSTDGITWQVSTVPTGQWFSVAFGEAAQLLVETLNIIGGQGTAQTEEFVPATVYTVPTGKQTTVTSIFVANHDDTDSSYDLAVVPAGEELSLKHHIRWDMAVAAKDFENISTKITMSAGDKLVIFPSTVDTVSITAFGVEK